jgi:hypothetical protein
MTAALLRAERTDCGRCNFAHQSDPYRPTKPDKMRGFAQRIA